MHRCLQISEILLGVFELVFTSWECYSDLARLARTCRSFQGPAIVLLWREQPSLLPLVMCFPREILDFSETVDDDYAVTTVVCLQFACLLYAGSVASLEFQFQKFVKTPSVQDWERPSFYVKHIREVSKAEFSNIYPYELHASVFRTLLESCPSTPLLPNLRCLNYYGIAGNSNACVASLFTLFSPNLLQSLKSSYRLDSHDSHTFLTHLPNRCPQIEFLSISLLGGTLRLYSPTKLKRRY
jgi:hypothetical protein